jgi:hypothetical protein
MKRSCLPFRHDWLVKKVTAPMFDFGAQGILKKCRRCGKLVAK